MVNKKPKRQRIELTDTLSIRIVETYRKQIGDKTSAKTLGRIVQAFHSTGGQLGPGASNSSEAKGAGSDAIPTSTHKTSSKR
ncbi:MAG TPA: hypothetical protein DCM28_17815 [Phycisphaerales bacterium]|nr:hypothetical protein [Phycisphaerales bacterium]HCD31707.1 hypothetical protein [Phycisphaerales bacterium]|tara:strand:- start:1682 stop:1927 length:246 start_codon:yes stop_codon:yes gene_type:complete